MKNKFIKSPAELQKHVDYIIELSDIIDYAESQIKREEENHLNVDLILSEPLSVLKRRKEHRAQNHNNHTPHHPKPYVNAEHRAYATIDMPRRERLIVHGEIHEGKKVTFIDIIYSLFKPRTRIYR